MIIIKFMGIIGMLISECAYITQVYHIRRSKQVIGFSINFILLNLFGRLLSLIYAFNISQIIFGITLLIGFMIRFIFLMQIMLYKKISFKELINLSISEFKNV